MRLASCPSAKIQKSKIEGDSGGRQKASAGRLDESLIANILRAA
jgi:hypothetical protein